MESIENKVRTAKFEDSEHRWVAIKAAAWIVEQGASVEIIQVMEQFERQSWKVWILYRSK